jgi:hypothetical protein
MGISPSSSFLDLGLAGLSLNAPGELKVEPTPQILDLKGYTVLPGLVGMHNPLFFQWAAGLQRCQIWATAFRAFTWRWVSPQFAR